MTHEPFTLIPRKPLIVGSFGSLTDLLQCSVEVAEASCDVAEIRLDLLLAEGWDIESKPWAHLDKLPLLFTARCRSEGGAWDFAENSRQQVVAAVMADAALIDLELASYREMKESIDWAHDCAVPWVASFHQFQVMPAIEELRCLRDRSRELGAAAFKVAAWLSSEAEALALAEFQAELPDFCVSTMGMGPLAAASRVRCALAGSVLNYGYLGAAATAPGQWPASALRSAIQQRQMPDFDAVTLS